MFYSLIKQNENYAILEWENSYIYASNVMFNSPIKETYLYAFINGKFVIQENLSLEKKKANLDKLNKLKTK